MTLPRLTEEEKVQVRSHLNYLNVTEAMTMVLGTPAASQPQFIIEGAMDRVKAEALPLVRRWIARCNQIEDQMFDNAENQAVESIGDIRINRDEFESLRDKPLLYARCKLATALGVYINPYAQAGTGGPSINVPVLG